MKTNKKKLRHYKTWSGMPKNLDITPIIRFEDHKEFFNNDYELFASYKSDIVKSIKYLTKKGILLNSGFIIEDAEICHTRIKQVIYNHPANTIFYELEIIYD